MAGVEAGQAQEVIDQVGHASRRSGGIGQGRLEILGVGLGPHLQEGEIGADDRQRIPQLVRSIGHESPLPFERFLELAMTIGEAIEHGVEARGQGSDFVVGFGGRQTPLEVTRRSDLGGRGGKLAERLESTVGDES